MIRFSFRPNKLQKRVRGVGKALLRGASVGAVGVLAAVGLARLNTTPVHAQAVSQPAVQVIPVESLGFDWALSPGGKTVAVFNNAVLNNNAPDPGLRAIRTFSLEDGGALATFGGEFDWVRSGLFLGDGTLMTLHLTGEARIWNAETGELLNTWQTPFIGGGQVQLAPDGERVVLYNAANLVSTISLFNPTTGYIEQSFVRQMDTVQELIDTAGQFPGRGDYTYTSVALSPDGTQIAVATQNDEIVLWSTDDPAGREAVTLRPASERFAQLALLQLRFAPDGESLWVVNTREGQLEHWSLTGELIETVGEDARNYALSPDGSRVAWITQAEAEAPQVWMASADGDAVQALYTLPEGARVLRPNDHLRFAEDGSALIVGGLAMVSTPENNALYMIALP